jgi:AcrR family transcriptional regulator
MGSTSSPSVGMSSIHDLDAKRRYLDAAVSLALRDTIGEPAFGHLVSHVRLSDVAERLELSRASLYKLWPTQHDFWVDLATFVTVRDDEDPWITSGIEGLGPALDAADGDHMEAVRVWFDSVEQRLAADPRLVLRSASLGYPMPDELVRHRTATERRHRSHAAAALRKVLLRAGCRPVASLSIDDVVLALTLLIDGTAMFSWSAPDLAGKRIEMLDEHGPTWSVLAYGARCVLEELIEPGELPPWSPPSVHDADPDPAIAPAWSRTQLRALREGAAALSELIDGSRATTDHSADALGHVGIDQVARAAGVTRRHLYNLWQSQSEFRADLLVYMSEKEFGEYFTDFDDSAMETVVSIRDPAELTLTIAELVNTKVMDADRSDTRATFAFRSQLTDPGLRERLQRNLELAIDHQADRLRTLAELLQIDGAPGDRVGTEDLAMLLVVTGGGSERLNHIDPALARAKRSYRGGSWSIFSIICQCLISRSVGAASSAHRPLA